MTIEFVIPRSKGHNTDRFDLEECERVLLGGWVGKSSIHSAALWKGKRVLEYSKGCINIRGYQIQRNTTKKKKSSSILAALSKKLARLNKGPEVHLKLTIVTALKIQSSVLSIPLEKC